MKNLKNIFGSYYKVIAAVMCLLILVAVLIPTISKASALRGQDAIGEAKAKQIAFTNASTTAGEAKNVRVGHDRENGIFVYEVDFAVNGNKYEYDINAKTGKIVQKDVEVIKKIPEKAQSTSASNTDVNKQNTKPQQTSSISMEGAKRIALDNAGVSAAECRDMDIEKDYDCGVPVWEVGFNCNNCEYDFDIDASTGVIIDKDVEYDD